MTDINRNRPDLWKADIAASVDQFNTWFMDFAPAAFRETRVKTTERVKDALIATRDLQSLTPQVVLAHPAVVSVLRSATAPPIARDRLIGLAGVPSTVVNTLEDGELPKRMARATLLGHLDRICQIIARLLDRDIFPWLGEHKSPTDHERVRASTIVADRLCSAATNPIIRNAQEQRQLALIGRFLEERSYRRLQPPSGQPLTEMVPGTYALRVNVEVTKPTKVNIPIDVVIQPRGARRGRFPILIEAKSAGDFTNTNKRRKEEAIKIQQLQATYGAEARLILFLCGYFGTDYLGYEAGEGLDWIWEHRIEDLLRLGV